MIKQCFRESGDFESSIFVGAENDGDYGMILTLKRVNSHLVYHYFKMDILLSAMAMMKPTVLCSQLI